MTDHQSCDGYPVTVGGKFWTNDLRVAEITEVAPYPGQPYADTGEIQTWHKTTDGISDTLTGSMRPYGRLVRYYGRKDAREYPVGTNYADIR